MKYLTLQTRINGKWKCQQDIRRTLSLILAEFEDEINYYKAKMLNQARLYLIYKAKLN